MFRDLRFGARMLLKQPGFTLIAVLTLALGIGATSAVFSLIQGVLLTPPPYPQPEQLVLVRSARTDGQQNRGTWPAAQWMEWQTEAESFEAIAAYNFTWNYLISPENTEWFQGLQVTSDYFSVVGLEPVLGRTFLESEHGPSAERVVILGYEFWQRRFNGDTNILGKTIRVSRQETPSTVIGVMPPSVRFLPSPNNAQEPNYDVNALVDAWFPAAPNPERLKRARWNVVGRLESGVTPEEAQAELALIAQRQAQADPELVGLTPKVQSLTAEFNRDGERILLPLFGAAALVLLIACGNVAALLLLRGVQRQQEYAVRSALGAGRAGLFRQASAESLLLALAGGGLGAGLALGVVWVFKLIGGHAIPRLDAVTAGWPVLGCGLGLAIVAAMLAGLIPAYRASRLAPMEVLKTAGPKSTAGRGERRLLRSVTIAQTALTLVLLVGAGLLIRTMINLSNVQSGYETSHVLTMSVTNVERSLSDFHVRALERVSALPGIQHAAFAWGVPLTGNSWPGRIAIEGQAAAGRVSDEISVAVRSITPGYFELLGLDVSDGRDFRSSDNKEAPSVAVINQAFVDRYFPDTIAVGKTLWMRGRDGPPTEIIGVVANSRSDDLTQQAVPEIYTSLWQERVFSWELMIRTETDPLSLSVASRRHEIAIRTAVGAERRDIRKLILSDGFRLIAGGVVAGLAGALVLSRVLRSFLFEVEPTDPATLIGVGLLFVGVALLACWVPTRRALEVHPLEALRYE